MSLFRAAFLLMLITALAPAADVRGETATATPGLQPDKPATGRFVETDRGFMVPYTTTIPGTDIEFRMVPVPGGVAEIGAASAEEDAEQPTSSPRKVQLAPYWIAEHEVTWDEYWNYMALDGSFSKIKQLRNLVSMSSAEGDSVAPLLKKYDRLWQAIESAPDHVDGITSPTPLYDPSATYESGEEPRLPAVTMTPYAAKQYTKWLSEITGATYRLPSEAEWEHAALAGGPAPYGAGEDGAAINADSLDDYAWTDSNSDYAAHEVGKKKPNAWGVYDMVGNVAELVLDEHQEEQDAGDASKTKTRSWAEAVAWPTKADARIAKGGWYDAPPVDSRVASRMPTNNVDWKGSDPNYPKSPWWFADYPATGVGFRLVRPLEPIPDELQPRVWEIDHEDIQADVATRLEEGRGKLQSIDENLPEVVEQLKEGDVEKLLN